MATSTATSPDARQRETGAPVDMRRRLYQELAAAGGEGRTVPQLQEAGIVTPGPHIESLRFEPDLKIDTRLVYNGRGGCETRIVLIRDGWAQEA